MKKRYYDVISHFFSDHHVSIITIIIVVMNFFTFQTYMCPLKQLHQFALNFVWIVFVFLVDPYPVC